MSVFDQAKDKAERFVGDANEKFGQNRENQDEQDEQGGGMDRLKGKADDAMNSARKKFGQK
jgi:hypothetical protein